jgi:hypothetical protein
VVPCTKRKTRPIPDEARLRSVAGASPEERVERWVERLRGSSGETVPALSLYGGDHWSVVRSVASDGDLPYRVQLWVCSAGYGLVAADAPLRPYSATFSKGHPDSTHATTPELGQRESFRRWWRALARWEGPVPGAARSVLDLAHATPEATILVAGSARYLGAMEDDLLQARRALESPEALTIVSAAGVCLGQLESSRPAFDARLARKIGGGLMSLNVRVLREVLRGGTAPPRTPDVAARVAALASGLAPFQKPRRAPLTDDEVRAYLREELYRSPGARWSPLHRRLRDAGSACEQKRFRRLHEEVRAESGSHGR